MKWQKMGWNEWALYLSATHRFINDDTITSYCAVVTEEIPRRSYTLRLFPDWNDREQAYASLREAQAAAEAILTLEGIL